MRVLYDIFRRDPSLFMLVTLVVIIAPFFFIGGPDKTSGPIFGAIWNLGHIIFFALVLMAIQIKYSLSRWKSWLLVTLVVLCLGCLIEYLQSKIGREANWQDVINNLAGAWFGMFWLQRANLVVWIARLAVLVLLAPPFVNLVQLVHSKYQAMQMFPVLADFEQGAQMHRWAGPGTRSVVQFAPDNRVLKVELGTERYSGMGLRRFLGDWRNADSLAFDLYNPDQEPLTMVVRVHDLEHELGNYALNDRYNQRLEIHHGWNYFHIDMSEIQNAAVTRKLDLQKIRGIEFFARELPQTRVIYVDNLRLESRPTKNSQD